MTVSWGSGYGVTATAPKLKYARRAKCKAGLGRVGSLSPPVAIDN